MENGRTSTSSSGSNAGTVVVPENEGVALEMRRESRPFWSKDVKDTRKAVVKKYLFGVALITGGPDTTLGGLQDSVLHCFFS